MFTKISYSVLVFIFALSAYSQKIVKPNIASKSHPTLNISSITITQNEVQALFELENLSEKEDWFCVDKNTYIYSYHSEKKGYLKTTQGIVNCPENYKFTYKGEKLEFLLIFPKPDTNTKFIDIIEDCENYCFNFKGVVIDKEFNKKINTAYTAYNEGNSAFALRKFISLINEYQDYPYSIFYFNVIKLYTENGNLDERKVWIDKLKESNKQDKDYFINIIEKTIHK